MQKFVLGLLALAMMGMVGCASNETHNGRFISSVDQGCRLEKRDGRDHYRVLLEGKPYNGYWYSYSDAAGLIQRLEDKGRCEY